MSAPLACPGLLGWRCTYPHSRQENLMVKKLVIVALLGLGATAVVKVVKGR
ncbi:hypothetical protein JK386_04015 [Nocardioides sp. zg-536]|uniref:Uncharacterized protein n=1 Tax=Nocardioides faecalis TaxID=2803858 RepID=A0A939BV09_9ACTN|nr:hypothetical protein [Nocardioides faecalis]MBM9459057.1 hypothetical protein [Nocardioides faecalis]MBS4753841.1 hypothetical protein [Nocardioides faecalis]QVI57321.1 hypothetical protein KG111_09275 [Nocardioides faecalis]